MLTIACSLAAGLGLELGLDLVFGDKWLCARMFTTFRCHCHTARLCRRRDSAVAHDTAASLKGRTATQQ